MKNIQKNKIINSIFKDVDFLRNLVSLIILILIYLTLKKFITLEQFKILEQTPTYSIISFLLLFVLGGNIVFAFFDYFLKIKENRFKINIIINILLFLLKCYFFIIFYFFKTLIFIK